MDVSGTAEVVAACAVVVFCRGSGHSSACSGGYHFSSRLLAFGAGGGHLDDSMFVWVESGGAASLGVRPRSSLVVRPRSYRSWAAGGLFGWRYHASSNTA